VGRPGDARSPGGAGWVGGVGRAPPPAAGRGGRAAPWWRDPRRQGARGLAPRLQRGRRKRRVEAARGQTPRGQAVRAHDAAARAPGGDRRCRADVAPVAGAANRPPATPRRSTGGAVGCGGPTLARGDSPPPAAPPPPPPPTPPRS